MCRELRNQDALFVDLGFSSHEKALLHELKDFVNLHLKNCRMQNNAEEIQNSIANFKLRFISPQFIEWAGIGKDVLLRAECASTLAEGDLQTALRLISFVPGLWFNRTDSGAAHHEHALAGLHQTDVSATTDGEKLILNGTLRNVVNSHCGTHLFAFLPLENETELAMVRVDLSSIDSVHYMEKNWIGLSNLGCVDMVFCNTVVSKYNFQLAIHSATERSLLKILTFALIAGALNSVVEESFDYALKRKAFDKLIIQHQLVAARCSQMLTSVKSLQLMLWRLCGLIGENGGDPAEFDKFQHHLRECVHTITRDGIQTYGAHGYMGEFRYVSELYKDLKTLDLWSSE